MIKVSVINIQQAFADQLHLRILSQSGALLVLRSRSMVGSKPHSSDTSLYVYNQKILANVQECFFVSPAVITQSRLSSPNPPRKSSPQVQQRRPMQEPPHTYRVPDDVTKPLQQLLQ